MLVASDVAPLSSTIWKLRPCLKSSVVLVTKIVSPDKEASHLVGNLIDHALQGFRVKMHSIAKDAALRVISGFHQFQDLARCQNLVPARANRRR